MPLLAHPHRTSVCYRISGSFKVTVERKQEVKYLIEVKDKIVKGISKCLKEKSAKIKVGCFTMLQELAMLVGKELQPDVKLFVGAIKDALLVRQLSLAIVHVLLGYLPPHSSRDK